MVLKNTKHIWVLLALLISAKLFLPDSLQAQQLSHPKDYDWMMEYSDPIDLAQAFIEKTKVFWTPTGKTWVELTYQVGFKAARYGGRYILLESPRLSAELVKSGAWGTLGEISYDAMVDLIKTAVQSPEKLCKELAQSTIDEGLRDYNTAYQIARNYMDNGIMTVDDAITFLCNRWNFLKLGIARQLYIQTHSDNDITQQMGEIVVKDIINQAENRIKLKLEANKNIPLMQAALLIHEVTEILKSRSLGIMRYTPYLTYQKNMEGLNQIKINELYRMGYTSCNGTLVNFDDFTIIPGVRVGRINASTSLSDLIQIFGNQNVENKPVGFSDELQPEYHTFINHGELEIVWKDNLDFQNPSMVVIPHNSKKYRTADHIQCGLSLQTVQNINGRYLFLKYLDEFAQWYVSNYNTGALNTYQDRLILYFSSTNPTPVRHFRSDENRVKKFDWKVCELHVMLDPDADPKKLNSNAQITYRQMPTDIQNYLHDYHVPCYQWPHDIPETDRMDLNEDGNNEYIVWFVGCPDTRGRGIVFIFDGKDPSRVLAQYFGYEVSGPVSVELAPDDVQRDYKTLKIGSGDQTRVLHFENSMGRYELFW